MGLDRVRWIEVPHITGGGATLSFIEAERHVPFEIKRVYYLYHIQDNIQRGGHAHNDHEELILPLAGSFDMRLDDGAESRTFHLDSPWRGLFIPTMVWHELLNFSPGAVAMVCASHYFDHEDYYRTYEAFRAALKKGVG